MCGGPIELPDAHDTCMFCLGRAHGEAALDRPDCPFCEEMSVRTLRARISTILNCAPATSLPPPPAEAEPREERPRPPRGTALSDERAHFQHTGRSRPSDDVRDLVSLGSTTADDDDDDFMSTAASDSGDWSCQESEAPLR